MKLQRRELLRLAATGSALLCLPSGVRAGLSNASTEPQYLAARRRDGRFEAVLLDARGRDLKVVPLPDRGHSFAIDPQQRRAVVFGRQPGFFALAFNLDDAYAAQPLPLPKDRHFFGHGCFSADGSQLFATENDFDGERGVIGIYEVTVGNRWRRLGEFGSGGIGPHEVVLMPDGNTLCVANGGILTHPGYGKRELNLDTMQPSLAYLDARLDLDVDARGGRLLEQHRLPEHLHQLSIRHLALDAQGDIWFGCQYFGPLADQPALVGRHRRSAGVGRREALELFSGPPDTQHALRGYIGSVAADQSGNIIATSSPVGGLTCYWRASDGRFLGSTARADGCGIAAAGDGRFLLSDGFGAIAATGPDRGSAMLRDTDSSIAWDNHLRKV